MIWVSIQKRKPQQEGYYYWKGKSNYGGRAYYNTEINEGNNKEGFAFDDSIPSNKVDEDYLYWLDETDAKYEERDDTCTEDRHIEGCKCDGLNEPYKRVINIR